MLALNIWYLEGYSRLPHLLQISVQEVDLFGSKLLTPLSSGLYTRICWTVRQGHYTVQTDFKLRMYPRISSNLLSPCLGLQSAVIIGMCYCIHLVFLHLTNIESQQELTGKEYQSPPPQAGNVFLQKVIPSLRVPLCIDLLLPVSGNCSSCQSSQRV